RHAIDPVRRSRPPGVGHGRPAFAVETAGLLQPLEDERIASRIEGERVPRYGEEAFADAEHAAARDHRVGDRAVRCVDHHVRDAADDLAAAIEHLLVLQRVAGDNHWVLRARWLSMRMTPSSRCASAEAIAACSCDLTFPVRLTTPCSEFTETSAPAMPGSDRIAEMMRLARARS